jgi:hypothetical protein
LVALGACGDDSAGTPDAGIDAAIDARGPLPFAEVTLPGPGPYVDFSVGDGGQIALATTTAVLISMDGGATFPTATAIPDYLVRTVAIAPDGSEILVGQNLGYYTFLDGAGAVVVASRVPGLDVTEHVRDISAQLQVDIYPPLYLVTTGSDDSTDGHLFLATFRADDPDFTEVNPFRNPQNPQLRVTASYHGVALCKEVNLHRRALVGAREWFGTNAWQPHLRVSLGFPSEPWMDANRPVAAEAASSLACADDAFYAALYPSFGIYTGYAEPNEPLATMGIDGQPLQLDLGPDRHLWVLTDRKLYRSTEPL